MTWNPHAPEPVDDRELIGRVLAGDARAERELYEAHAHVVVGLCRWTARDAAYVALMRDEYPHFRLDP